MSIRLKLTLWYSALVAISLLGFSILIYSLITGILITVIDDRLAIQARDVITLIKNENDPAAVLLSGRVRLPSIDVFASQYYVQIVQADGRPVQLSDNLRNRQLPLLDSIVQDISAGETRTYTVDAGQDTRLRVISAPLIVAGRPTGAVQVAQSMTGIEDALRVVRGVLMFGTVLFLLLAAAGGAVLARAALRPIGSITETAERITLAEDLSQRIPVTVPHDEVGRLAATINGMLSRLEVLFKAQQRLVADVSHDLRTPLTTIQGNVDLLRRGAADDPEKRADALRAIGDEVARMRRMVNDLLLLAQVDAGLKLHRQPVELDTLLLDVYRQAQMMAQDKVTVRLGAEDQALVMGDGDRLRQLLLNLVDNALKYTPAGGQVRLTLLRSEGWVQVGVADTGIGISAEDLPHIFERHYRADRSRGPSGGHGLGLAIVQWIAKAHGGRIEVTSELGKGSTFTLWLPDATTENGKMMEKVDA
jgi:heavy metal sensor kinase